MKFCCTFTSYAHSPCRRYCQRPEILEHCLKVGELAGSITKSRHDGVPIRDVLEREEPKYQNMILEIYEWDIAKTDEEKKQFIENATGSWMRTCLKYNEKDKFK